MKSLMVKLNEKAPQVALDYADIIVGHILSMGGIDEMRTNRGKDFDSTKFYQIRVKPEDKETPLETILSNLEKFLKSTSSKKLGIEEVQINPRSRNSGKYSSVSFSINGLDYDIVVAAGANKGETFEQELLLKMDNLVAGIEDSDQATAAFNALQEIDKDFAPDNIKSVSARTGSTQRSGDITPEEAGKIIADIVVTLKNDDKKYISVKNTSGATVANFGCSKAFSEDLKVNTKSDEWKNWIAPFGLDAAKIEEGLAAAKDGTDIKFDDVEKTSNKLKPGSVAFKLLQKLWGANYYYLREKGAGFTAMKIDRDYVDNHLLKNLTVTEIRYPSKDRKQITISLVSDTKKFKVEIRNSKGKIRPTEIKFGISGEVKTPA